MYTLDTNTVIYYQKRDARVVPVLRSILLESNTIVYVSTITEAELFSFSQLSPEEVAIINNILQTTARIPVDSQIARAAGRIRGTYHLKLADSLIAATALFTGSTLLTRNVRDFKNVPNLRLQQI